MKRNLVLSAFGLTAAALIVTGCAAPTQNPADTASPPTETSQTATPGSAPADEQSTPGSADASWSAGGAVDELRDGPWQVGEAGEVEFVLQNGSLALTDVRPADGWKQRVSDEKPDEIEVHFTRDYMDWKFEVELDTNTLEISKELKITEGEAGKYQVGSAAEVTFDTDGTTVSVSNVQVTDGWVIVKQDESADDIELEFRNDSTNGSAEFEAEADDAGVELEISQKLSGPIPD